jgi:hypothetical protein
MINLPKVNANDLINSVLPTGNNSKTEEKLGFHQKDSDSINLIKGKSLTSIDPFLAWEAIKPEEYLQKYLYNFVIYDLVTNKTITSFTFPLNPQNITINVPAAVSTTVTMRGVLEEHNGAPLRSIVISGTTGISPKSALDRGKTPPDNSPLGIGKQILNKVFGDTIKRANKAINSVNEAISAAGSAISGKSPDQKFYNRITWKNNDEDDSWKKKVTGFDLGYTQLHDLARFFDFYLAVKKTAGGKNYRLVFEMHKDKMYYDVTLNNFGFVKAPGTLEYSYSITLTAWKRRKVPVSTRTARKFDLAEQTELDFGQRLDQAGKALKKGRKAVAEASEAISSIKSDISSVFSTVNEALMLINDASGTAVQAAELIGIPPTENSIWASIGRDITSLGVTASRNPAIPWTISVLEEITKIFSFEIGSEATKDSINEEVSGYEEQWVNPNLPDEENRALPDLPNAAAVLSVFEKINISDLNDPEINSILDAQLEKVRELTPDDFRQKRDYILDFAEDVSKYFQDSANSETGIDTSNLNILYGLNEIAMGMDMLISALESTNDVRDDDYNAFYRDFAISNGLNFQNSQSKFYVPFPYGSSLESLAYEYLGDPDRWIEIAALNGLKSPYIDEEGFEVGLTSSAIGDSVTVSDTKNFYIGQIVKIFSDTKKAVVRKIRSIDTYSAVESIIIFEKVDGETLSGYKLSDNAKIKTYLPNTVNSLKLIAIPSQQPVTITGRMKIGAQIEELDTLAKVAKTDFLLNSNGDIAFTSGGDVLTASGLTNITQAAMIKLRTKVGYLLQHPGFGAGVDPGSPTSEIDATQVLESIRNSFDQDSRFSSILATSIEKNGPALNIKILVGVAETQSLLPLETEIPL